MGREKISTQREEITTLRKKSHVEGMTFERASHQVISGANELMKEYTVRERRKYHTLEHPVALAPRGEWMADVLELPEATRQIFHLARSWHDVVIEVDPVNPEDITAMVRRRRGAREGDQPMSADGNEAKSARRMELAMRRINEQERREIFSEEYIKKAVFAVEVTYPGVDGGKDFKGALFREYPFFSAIAEANPRIPEIIKELERQGITKGILFYQPHLEKPLEQGEKVPEEAILLGLADLGGAGMAEKEGFFREGDNEFQESYPNISASIHRLIEGAEVKDTSDREKAAGVMLNWLRNQISFVAWQMLRVEKILLFLQKNTQITEEQAAKMRKLFDHFEGNIWESTKRSREVEKTYLAKKQSGGESAAFKYLAGVMHMEA